MCVRENRSSQQAQDHTDPRTTDPCPELEGLLKQSLEVSACAWPPHRIVTSLIEIQAFTSIMDALRYTFHPPNIGVRTQEVIWRRALTPTAFLPIVGICTVQAW